MSLRQLKSECERFEAVSFGAFQPRLPYAVSTNTLQRPLRRTVCQGNLLYFDPS